MRGGGPLHYVEAHSGAALCSTIGSHSGGVLATGGDDKCVNIFRVDSGKRVMNLRHTSSVTSLSFSKREAKLVAGSSGGGVLVFDLSEGGKRSGGMRAHRTDVSAVAMHPFNESFVATGGGDTMAKLWDLRGRDCVHTFKRHSGGVGVTRFSPNGAWLITGGDDGAAHVWDLRVTGKRVATLEGGPRHSGSGAAVTCVEFHPTELLVATGSADRSARIFDLDADAGRNVGATAHARAPSGPISTGGLLATIHESASIRSLVFTRDGHGLCTATDDALNVWTGAWEGAPLEKVAKFSMKREREWNDVDAMWSSKDSSQLIAIGRRGGAVATWVVPLDRDALAAAAPAARPRSSTGAARPASSKATARSERERRRAHEPPPSRGRAAAPRYEDDDDEGEGSGAYGHRRADVYREERERTRVTRAERARARDAAARAEEDARAREVARRAAAMEEERRAREEREAAHRRRLAAAEAEAAERLQAARAKAVRVAAEYEAAERARRAAEETKREAEREAEREAAARRRRMSPPPRSPVSEVAGLASTTLGSTGRSASYRADQSYGYGDDYFEDDFEEEEEVVEAVGEAARSRRRGGANVDNAGVGDNAGEVADIVEDVFTTSPLNLNLSRGSRGETSEIEEEVPSARCRGASSKTPSRVVRLDVSCDSPIPEAHFESSPERGASPGASPGAAIAAALGRSYGSDAGGAFAGARQLSAATPLLERSRAAAAAAGEDTLGETVILPPRLVAAVNKAALARAQAVASPARGGSSSRSPLRAAGARSLGASSSGGRASLLDAYATNMAAARGALSGESPRATPRASERSPEVARASAAAAQRRNAESSAAAKRAPSPRRASPATSPATSPRDAARARALRALSARELKHRAFELRVPLSQTRQCTEKQDLVALIMLHEDTYFEKHGTMPAPLKSKAELEQNEVHAPAPRGGAGAGEVLTSGGAAGRELPTSQQRARPGSSASGARPAAPRERAPSRPSRPSSAASTRTPMRTPTRTPATGVPNKSGRGASKAAPRTPVTPRTAGGWDLLRESDYDASRPPSSPRAARPGAPALDYALETSGFAYVRSSREDPALNGPGAQASMRLQFGEFIPKRLHDAIRAAAFEKGDEGQRAVDAVHTLLATALAAVEHYAPLDADEVEHLARSVSKGHGARTRALADELAALERLKAAWASLGEFGQLEACITASDLVRGDSPGAVSAVASWLARIDFGDGEWSLQHCVVLLTAIAKVSLAPAAATAAIGVCSATLLLRNFAPLIQRTRSLDPVKIERDVTLAERAERCEKCVQGFSALRAVVDAVLTREERKRSAVARRGGSASKLSGGGSTDADASAVLLRAANSFCRSMDLLLA